MRLDGVDLLQIYHDNQKENEEMETPRLRGSEDLACNSIEEQVGLFLEVFNMVCTMNQRGKALTSIKLEPKQVAQFQCQKFLGTFVQVPTKGMPQPLHLSLSHGDFGGLGV